MQGQGQEERGRRGSAQDGGQEAWGPGSGESVLRARCQATSPDPGAQAQALPPRATLGTFGGQRGPTWGTRDPYDVRVTSFPSHRGAQPMRGQAPLPWETAIFPNSKQC